MLKDPPLRARAFAATYIAFGYPRDVCKFEAFEAFYLTV